MIEDYTQYSPEDAGNPEEGVALRSREDWLQEVQRLEADRDRIRGIVADSEFLSGDPDYNFVLGKISVAQAQLRAFTTDEAVAKIQEIS